MREAVQARYEHDLSEDMRAVMQGYADGVTFSRSIARAWWLLPKAVVVRPLRYQRAGRSQPLALGGPVRGLPYMFEPMLRRVQRVLGLGDAKS